MDQAEWTAAHVEAFAFFGGVPARLVPDNLKTGVDKPDLYDPKINRSYAELAAHYGTLVDPARAFKPKDKPQVERPMPYVRDSFWRGREFTSLPEMRAAALVWCTEVAGARACRPLDGAAPAAVFDAVEREQLRAVAGSAVRAGPLVERAGRPGHPRQRRRGRSTRCRGATSGTGSTSAPRSRWCSCSTTGSWSRPTPARTAGSRPTSGTTRRRRSPSTCAPRPGVAAKPPASARPPWW